MSELYRLVFRGEVLPGQHPAVVRKRLAQAASFDEAALEKLFSGRPVVLKRETDRTTAARFQALFKKAGARLRVLPVEAGEAHDRSDDRSAALPASARGPAPDGELELLPAGADVLREDERTPWRPRPVDTTHLRLQGAQFFVSEATPAEPALDVTHLSLAELGENLGPEQPAPQRVVQAPDLPVAPPGERLTPPAAPTPPAVDVDGIAFDLAEVGADIGTKPRPAPPPAPDVSHLKLVDGD